MARMNQFINDECPFSPSLNARSLAMTGSRSGAIHDRLLEAGKSRDKKLKKLMKTEKDAMFSPSIGFKSRQLAEGINSNTLVKLDNGQT
jgi:hypothetical protein